MARLDTGWHANPKVLGLGLAAMGLHAWSISYCDATLSDGFIPQGAWPSLPGVGAACKALLVHGVWERCDGGFRLHDYLEYNRSRAQIAAQQAEDRVRKRRPESARNPPGIPTDSTSHSGRIPRAPGPGPGLTPGRSVSPVVTPAPASRAPARVAEFRPLTEALPPEVLARLQRPPITDHLTNHPDS